MTEDSKDDGASPAVVKSAGRVFEVLELFRRERRPLSGAEIGQALEFPKSSSNALLKSLVRLGYLTTDGATPRYFPSLSVTALGEWIPAVVLGAGDVAEILAEVHAATQETVTLVVKSDLECRFLKVIPGTYPISLRMTEGFVAPLFGTAVGTAVLSQLPDDQIAILVGRANARSRRKAEQVDGGRVMKDVREARTRGYAIAYDAVFPDTGAISVSFRSDIETYPMAIGVGGLRERIRRNEQMIFRAIRASLARHLRRSSRASSR